MSLRLFIGLVGVALAVAGLGIYGSYRPTVSIEDRYVACGTVHDAGFSADAGGLDQRNRLIGEPTGFTAACVHAIQPFKFMVYGMMAVGAVVALGAATVRTPPNGPAVLNAAWLHFLSCCCG